MANTTFTAQSTIIRADWLNPVNGYVYKITNVTATAGQRIIPVHEYVINGNSLVMINGLVQKLTDAYTESSTTSITFTEDLEAGDVVTFRG